jgi:hypothetical protein
MEKVCSACGSTKKITSFHKRQIEPDGYAKRCKICVNLYNHSRKKNAYKEELKIGLTALRKEDWCQMYSFLEQIGYNTKEDIHGQFIKKHNIPEYKERPKKNNLTYTGCDCLD